jgi:hypothetical protein
MPYSGEQSRLRRLALKEQEPLLALLGGETPRSSDRIGQQKLARAMPHSAFAATHAVQATRCRTSHPLPSLRGFKCVRKEKPPTRYYSLKLHSPRMSHAVDADGRPSLVHDEHVWNLAIGSNMDVEKLQSRNPQSRPRITPLHAGVPATVPGWALSFDLMGVPPFEPAVAAAVPNPDGHLHGVLYKMSRADYLTLSISEGCCARDGSAIAGSPYQEVVVQVLPYPAHPLTQSGAVPGSVLAVVFALRKRPLAPLASRNVFPSKRYLDLLVKGAAAAQLDQNYVELLRQHPTCRPGSSGMAVLAKFFCIAYFPMLSKKRLAAAVHYLIINNLFDAYARREHAFLSGHHRAERIWNAYVVFYMLPLVCLGVLKAFADNRPVFRIARETIEQNRKVV